jgi:hypothetical protein
VGLPVTVTVTGNEATPSVALATVPTVVTEPVAALLLEPVAQRRAVGVALEQRAGRPVKPRQIGEHAMKRRGQQVSAFGEQTIR